MARTHGFHLEGLGSVARIKKIFFLYLYILLVYFICSLYILRIIIPFIIFDCNYLVKKCNLINHFYSSNIDVRIQQAELEYRLGREELELLTLREESRALQAALELAETQEKQKNDTIFRYLS